MYATQEVPDRRTIGTALEVACRAPSVHNTQPWRWAVAAHSVHLFADRSRQLPVIDHYGRELALSCGAALHHARIAFRALGWTARTRLLPNPADPDHLAALGFAALSRVDQRAPELVRAAEARRSDRRPFRPDPVPAALLDRIAAAAHGEHVGWTVLADDVRRRELIVALAHADSVQRRDPMYAAELAEWTGRWLGARHGVPASSVPVHGPAGRAAPGRDYGPGELESPPPVDDGAVLCVLSTVVDDEVSWLRAGQALSAALLTATRAGLATCTLSQAGEITVTRDLIRQVALDGRGEPQLALRIGWPVTAAFPGPATPRRGLGEVVRDWRDAD